MCRSCLSNFSCKENWRRIGIRLHSHKSPTSSRVQLYSCSLLEKDMCSMDYEHVHFFAFRIWTSSAAIHVAKRSFNISPRCNKVYTITGSKCFQHQRRQLFLLSGRRHRPFFLLEWHTSSSRRWQLHPCPYMCRVSCVTVCCLSLSAGVHERKYPISRGLNGPRPIKP